MTSETLPEPLVPAYVDLRGFPYMPIDIVRLFGSEFHAHSSDSEWRAGVTLWLKSFHQVPAASLPDDDIVLARLAEFGRDLRGWKKVKQGAMRGWILCRDGLFYHPVVAEKAMDAWKSKQCQVDRTAAAREARARKRLSQSMSQTAQSSVTENVTEVVTGSNITEQNRTEDSSLRSESGVADATPAKAPSDREIAERLAASWREVLAGTGLAMPSKLNRRRIAAAAARWGDELGRNEAQWRAFLGRIRGSPFLLGGGPRGWKADFDWALQPGSILATLEGKYDPRPAAKGHAAGDDVDPAWTEADQWRTRLGHWRLHGSWLAEMWGPPPGKPGCVVPSNLLEEFA